MIPAEVFEHYKRGSQALRNGWLTWVEPIMCECVREKYRGGGCDQEKKT